MFRSRHPTAGLDAYLDGELAAVEAERAQAHLDDCPGCAEAPDTTLAIRRTRKQVRRLIGVYNASGGLTGELAYWISARLGRAHCALCDITHGSIREKPEWKACRATVPIPFETLHLEEQTSGLRRVTEGLTPCVLADTDDGPVMLLGPDDLEACAGSPQCLLSVISDTAARLGLDLGE